MRVRYDEGVAIHVGPEPCVSGREARGEASAGERAGQPLSRESPMVLDADAVTKAEGHTIEGASASPRRRGAGAWFGIDMGEATLRAFRSTSTRCCCSWTWFR